MKKALLLTALIITSIGYSQTKTIAHKRHSGSKSSFSKMLHLEGLNGGTSNLGMAPERWVRNSELKKVIFINDTTQAMVTEETCKNLRDPQQQTDLWKAGTDTVQKHPLFSSGISVDSMRTILKSEYYFTNDMKDVEFVDFEKRKQVEMTKKEIRREKVKAQIAKREEKRSHKSAFGKYGWLMIVFASSIGIGIINLK